MDNFLKKYKFKEFTDVHLSELRYSIRTIGMHTCSVCNKCPFTASNNVINRGCGSNAMPGFSEITMRQRYDLIVRVIEEYENAKCFWRVNE